MLYRGRPKETLGLAHACKTPYAEKVIKEKDGKGPIPKDKFQGVRAGQIALFPV